MVWSIWLLPRWVAIASVLLFSFSEAWQCGHTNSLQSFLDKNNTQTVEFVDSGFASSYSAATTSNRQNMRITLDLTNVNDPNKYCTSAGQVRPTFQQGQTTQCTEKDIFSDKVRTLLLDNILPAAVKYLSSALMVTPITSGFIVQQGTCMSEMSIPANLSTAPGVQGADMIIFITAGPTRPANVLAFAGSCSYISATGRPVVGIANFSPAALSEDGLLLPKINTAIHELMHVLGFTDNFWDTRFMSPNNVPSTTITIRGKSTKIIRTPNVVAKVRELTSCPTLAGAEIEDQGSAGTAGSHWEKRTFFNEIMTGVTFSGEVPLAVSAVTLALFADSGHYDVDYTKASPREAFWNTSYQSLGCGLSTDKCNLVSGGLNLAFCFNRALGCSTDTLSIAQCNLSTYSSNLPPQFQYNVPNEGGSVSLFDYCPFMFPVTSHVCVDPTNKPTPDGNGMYMGDGGRCYATTDDDGSLTSGGLRLPTATSVLGSGFRCLQSRCVSNVLEVRPGGATNWYKCNPAGGPISIAEGFLGKVVCPDSASMCANLAALANLSATNSNPTGTTQTPTTSSIQGVAPLSWVAASLVAIITMVFINA